MCEKEFHQQLCETPIISAVKSLMRIIKNPALQVQTYSTIPELIERGTTKTKLK